MAKGKIQHWKHGWIPLDDFARRLVGKKTKAEEQRAAREAAHQAENRKYNAWRASVGRPVDPDLIAMQEWGNDHQARARREVDAGNRRLTDQRARDTARQVREDRQRRKAAGLDDLSVYSGTATHLPDDERRARYAAHLKATADKRAAQQERYAAHLKATATKEAERRARYLAAQNRKH